MHTITIDPAQCLALARLIEQSGDTPAILYPLASLLRSRANLDRCDECGVLHRHADLDSAGDIALCRACGGTVTTVAELAAHPYRTHSPRFIAATIDAESHDVPAFMAGAPLELD